MERLGLSTYDLRITLDSPLAVKANRARSAQMDTLAHIPSTVVRGGLAALLQQTGAQAEDLDRLFGPHGIQPSDLLPSARDGVRSRVAPLTLRTCKRHPGFRGERQAHGAEDTLHAVAALGLSGSSEALDRVQTCPLCGDVLRPFHGFIGSTASGRRTIPAPGSRVQAHVGLDRRRDGAASGILFSRTVLNEMTPDPASPEGPEVQLVPTVFAGTVTAPEELLRRLARSLKPGACLTLGGAISRGLGRCTIEAFEPARPARPLRERIEAFQARWPASAQAASGTATPLIALTLLTPALFIDPFLRPLLRPDGAALLAEASAAEAHHAEALADLQPVLQVARPYTLAAWNGMTGAPHGADAGLAAGSTLLMQAPELSPGLLEALAYVEAAGVGLRRWLGFGRVSVCDPIHTDVHELSATEAPPSHG